ncbi:MAG: MerR family transcriptional regulator [Sarcina sp.]
MKNYFSIGEVSKMFEVSIPTLRYYDKIGILKPNINKDNDYRVYSFKDIYLLSAILGARYLEVPIKDIEYYLGREDLDLDMYLAFMEKQEILLKEKIMHLKKIKNSVIEGKKEIKRAKQVQGKFNLENIKKEFINTYLYKILIKELIKEGNCKRFSKVLEIKNKKFEYFTLFNMENENDLILDENFVYIEKNKESQSILSKMNKSNFEVVKIEKEIMKIEFLGTEKDIKKYIFKITQFMNLKKAKIYLKTRSYFTTKEEDYAFVEILVD